MLSMLLATALPSVGNPCLRFQGDDQVAMVPYQRLLDVKEITLEAWIKLDESAPERFYNYVLCRNYDDHGWGLALHGRPEKVFSQAPAAKARLGEWIHVARVCSDKAEKVYVNGEIAIAFERNGPLKPFEHALMIGNSDMFGSPGNEPTPFRGWIDEVRIWSRPRTQAQIRSTMRRHLRGNERGLIGYFPFNEGKGQIVRDYSGHLISGSLGSSFEAQPSEPTWSTDGPQLAGRLPQIRTRK